MKICHLKTSAVNAIVANLTTVDHDAAKYALEFAEKFVISHYMKYVTNMICR